MNAISPTKIGQRIVVWFSCGAASAVTVKLVQAALAKRHTQSYELAIVRCYVANEHPDNDRFAEACEQWFGQPILTLRSGKFPDAWAVWERRRYLAGVNGAPCTLELKKAIRQDFEREFDPDTQAFGYTAEEQDRADRFRENNPEVRLWTPLIEAGLTKADCLAMIERAGIALPAMYRLGYRNNNCIGCVKGGVGYWNKIRRDFPETFDRMAKLEREIGATVCKLTTGERDRVYLDELDPALGEHANEPDIDCSLLCVMAEQEIAK